MRRIVIPALATAVALGAAACTDSPEPPETPEPTETATHGAATSHGPALLPEDLLAASNALGPVLLAADPEAVNAVVSPASLTLALASLGAGATNEAATEFDAVLGSHGTPLVEAAAALSSGLDPYDGEPVVEPGDPPATPLVHVADHLVLDDDLTPEQSYLDLLTTVGGAELSTTDFAEPSSKDLLDEWVNLHTGGLIKESGITPDADLRLVIQNAVLFSARWQVEFDPNGTAPRTFTILDGTTVEPESMHDTLWVPYAEDQGWEAISLPYSEGFHTMVILPPVGEDPLSGGPEAVVERIDALSAMLADAGDEETVVQLPVLELTGDLQLADALTGAGLGDVFDPDTAPLDGIAADLFVSQAVQQGVLIVNERGTTAAAITELGLAGTAAPGGEPRQFVVDRPFLLTVTQDDGGWHLFQTVVRDPTAD